MQKLLEETLLCDSSQQISGYQQGWTIIEDQLKQILFKDNNIKYKKSCQKSIVKTVSQKVRVKKNSIIKQNSSIRVSPTRNIPLLNSPQKNQKILEVALLNDCQQCEQISDHCKSIPHVKNKINHPQRQSPTKDNSRLLSQSKRSFNIRGNNWSTVTKEFKQKRVFSSHSVNVCYSDPNQQQNRLLIVKSSKKKDGLVDEGKVKMKNKNKIRIREEIFGRPRKLTLCYNVDQVRNTLVSETNDYGRLRGSSFEAFGQGIVNQFSGSFNRSYKRCGTESVESKKILQSGQKATRLHTDNTTRDVISRKEVINDLHLPIMRVAKTRENSVEIQQNLSDPKRDVLFKQHKSITISEKPSKRLVQLTLGKENIRRGNCNLTKSVKSNLIGQLKLTLRATPAVQHSTLTMIKSVGRGN